MALQYVPTGIFDTLTEDVVLQIQAKAIEFMLAGKVIMNWQGEGISSGKQFAMSPNDVLQECKYSLKQIDPATYGYFIRAVKPYHA